MLLILYYNKNSFYNDGCIICDFENGYYMYNGSCIK